MNDFKFKNFNNYEDNVKLFDLKLKLFSKHTSGKTFKIFIEDFYENYKELFVKLINCLNPFKDDTNYNDKLFLYMHYYGKTFKCAECGREFLKKREFCSKQCRDISEIIKRRRKATNFKKFGTDNPFKSEKIKQKIKETCITRYGVEHHLQNKNIMNKQKETNLKKYGVASQRQRKEIIIQAKQTMLKKYGYEHNEYVHITNIENYNDKYILNNFVINGYLDKDSFIKYFNVTKAIAYRFIKKYSLKKANSASIVQKNLYEFIKNENKKLNVKSLIPPLEIDIVLPDCKLAIEYNGIYWHSSWRHPERYYHFNKIRRCYHKGYQLLNIFENENIEIWKSIINNKLGLNQKIYARKCILKHVNCEDAENFLNSNHVDGYINSHVNIGLYFNSKLVQIMTFIRNENNQYILSQFCSLLNTTVVGGCSKLFNYYIKTYKPHKIDCYADLKYGFNVNTFTILGFKLIKIIKPDYYYWRDDKIFDKNFFTKENIKNLKKYNESDTFDANLKNNRIYKVYTCGKLKFSRLFD